MRQRARIKEISCKLKKTKQEIPPNSVEIPGIYVLGKRMKVNSIKWP